MANGRLTGGAGRLTGGASDVVRDLVFSHITKAGAAGCALYSVATFGHAIVHKSFDEAMSGLGYLSFALIVGGAAFRSKRATDMIATTQAEAKIQSPFLDPTSADPAVEREIQRQQAAAPPPPPKAAG
jgi:hypothetical protein